MQEADHDAGQGRAQILVRVGGVAQIQRFAFFDQRTHPVNLPALLQLGAYALDDFIPPGFGHQLGDDGRAPRRQLVYGGHIQIGVIAHGQGARNRCGAHHQQMRFLRRARRLLAESFCVRQLLPQRQALRHAEAVLLIDDGQPQRFEMHFVLNDRVRADHQRSLAAFHHGQHAVAFFFLLAAGQPSDLQAQRLQHRRQPAYEFGEMLFGQYFGRRHQRALPTGVYALRRRQCCHHGFARTDIALQQAVHGNGARHVVGDFIHHALLRAGQLERQNSL